MHTPTEYAVFFTGPDNGPAFRRVGSLEEAVQVVEHLRNELGVVDANVHSLSPVPLSFRTYYRVEVPGQAEAPVAEVAEAVPAYVPSYEPSTLSFDWSRTLLRTSQVATYCTSPRPRNAP